MSKTFGKRHLSGEPQTIAVRTRLTISRYTILCTISACVAVVVYIVFKPSDPPSSSARIPQAKPIILTAPMPASEISSNERPTYPVITPETLCKERYPLNFERRNNCVRIQNEAKLEAGTFRIDDNVKMLCAKRYIYDWSMYVACAKEQMKVEVPDSDKPDRPHFDIGAKCLEKWPTNKSLEKYCIANQQKARAKASNYYIDNGVAVRCAGDYPADWELFIYCVEKQRGSKLPL